MYISQQDLEDRVGTTTLVQLSDDDGDGVPDAAVVQEILEGAEGEADSHLARRYAVPVDLAAFPGVQAVLRSFVLDLAEYRLHARRPPVPEDVQKKRAAAQEWFERVASGEVVLPSQAEIPGNPATGIRSETSAAPRLFTREELEDV